MGDKLDDLDYQLTLLDRMQKFFDKIFGAGTEIRILNEDETWEEALQRALRKRLRGSFRSPRGNR